MNLPCERSACGKIILCGEHAVVYGRPAIALPLSHLRTKASIVPSDRPFQIVAPDIDRQYDLVATPTHPLAYLARATFDLVKCAPSKATLTLTSAIPVASHLGSSASVSVACARAVAAYCGVELAPAQASALAFEAEKLFHGSPSGIDNTVVAYEQPVWFVRIRKQEARSKKQELVRAMQEDESQEVELISNITLPVLVIADTGITTPTRIPVGSVRRGWELSPKPYEKLFDRMAAVAVNARAALQSSDWQQLGDLMNHNHEMLQELGVSCAELDSLCDAARRAGALGAKMSGGGRGGNMIALARDPEHANRLRAALQSAGAKQVI